MKHTESYREVHDGKKVFLQSWLPDKKISASMILIHGMGEHSGRYGTDFADFFTSHNIRVHSFDLPGHGKSYGEKGHIDNPILLLEIIDELIKETAETYPGVPIFLYAHSFGGEIGLWYALARHPQVNGIIATSPLIGTKDPVPPVKLFLAKTMEKMLPAFSMDNGLRADDLSRDKKIVEGYINDPLVHPKISARTAMLVMNRGKWIMDNAKENTIDLLVMVGEQENIVNPDAIKEFSRRAPRVTLKVWPFLYHEIHNEPEKQEVFDYTLQWMKERYSS